MLTILAIIHRQIQDSPEKCLLIFQNADEALDDVGCFGNLRWICTRGQLIINNTVITSF